MAAGIFFAQRRVPLAFWAHGAYNNAYFLIRDLRPVLHPRRRIMRLFDILGPVMVGPSSSHTAGAVRIGLTARKLLGDRPVHADISLHGSFALTGHGHGTDCALIAGLLGMPAGRPAHPGKLRRRGGAGVDVHISKRADAQCAPEHRAPEAHGSKRPRARYRGRERRRRTHPYPLHRRYRDELFR